MSDHWAKYGRNYYARHNYEGIADFNAKALIEGLRAKLPSLAGTSNTGGLVQHADEFSYSDPIDQSVSHNQGIRVVFEDGSRIIFRLSGTGTVGGTLRVYIERYVKPEGSLGMTTANALASLVAAADEIGQIRKFTGMENPSVIT